MANSASTPLALAKDWAYLTLSADQSSNLAANNHVEFNTISGNLALATGSGQANGLVTLIAGRTYILTGQPQPVYAADNASATFQWYNVTAAAFIGSIANINSPGFVDSRSQSQPVAIITPAVNTQVTLRIKAITVSTISRIEADGTSAWIESVEAYTALSATQSYIRRTNGLTRGSTNTNVVIFGTADVSVGTDITYQNSATNGDSFLINTSGIYSLSFTAGLGTANTTIDLKVGSAIDNVSLNSNSRASVRSSFSGGDPVSVAWTGYIAAGQVAWVFAGNNLAGASYTAITVARVR